MRGGEFSEESEKPQIPVDTAQFSSGLVDPTQLSTGPPGAFGFIPGHAAAAALPGLTIGGPKDANAEITPNIEPVNTLSPEEEEQEILRLEKEQEEWNRRNDELRLALERQTKLAKLRQARQQQMAEHQKLLEQSQQAQAQQALAAQQMAQDTARQAAAHQAALAASNLFNMCSFH